MTPRAAKVLAVLLLATALFNSLSVFAFMSSSETFLPPVIAATVVLALPALIAAGWLFWWPGKKAVSLAAGVSIVSALGAVSMGSFAFLGAWNPGDAERVMQTIAVLVLPNVVLAVIAIVMALRGYGRSAIGSLAIGVVAAVMMDSVSALAALAAMQSINIAALLQYGRRDTQLAEAVTHVQACAIQYAEQNPGRGYPATLEDIGPGGSKCMDGSWIDKARQMNVRYVAEPRSASGEVPSFAVYGHTPVADSPDIRASADTAGIMASFTGTDSLLIPRGTERTVQRIAWLRNCALFATHLGKGSTVPGTTSEVLRVGNVHGRLELLMGCQYTDDAVLPNEPAAFTYEGHRVTYQPGRDATGAVRHFTIEARPVAYGVTAINSYLLRDSGPVYRTRSDRAATASDAVIPGCGYADSVRTTPQACVQLARPRLDPIVTLLHPTVIGRDESFTAYARDARDTSRAPDPSLWIGFSCQADSAHLEYMTAPPVSRRLEHQCHLSRWDPAKPYPVMLYYRDTLGGVGWRIDSIAVHEGSGRKP